jgi:hypothetical protein
MNAAHLHLMVNHAGLFATLFGGMILAVGMYRRQPPLVKAGLVLAVFGGLSAVVAVQTGERAEGVIEAIPGISADAIEDHEEAAELAQTASILLAAVALAALVLPKRRPTLGRVAVLGSLWMAMVVFGLTARVATLGGRIRHPEVVEAETASSIDEHATRALPESSLP